MNKAIINVQRINIPTYAESKTEELPMFSENRVHQRTSGRPYPNKVVLQVNREEKKDKEYTIVTLENDYVKVEILPEIGGRIYSALDKNTNYDFFYKQHVIKPALIGVFGSWISGGIEFNWPFHHRPSGFMPCDYKTEELADGSVVCWLSEHDPIDRMKGLVAVILRPDANYIETRMRLYNRTEVPHSFLWWENAAVPVNENYQIFFPQDVSYVNFHYLKSRITYPIAGSGVFNGIPMKEPRDISMHKNTREATSYFAAASDYDFFGGYDHGKQCGVVHIGNHHVSPGKKMFTWAYGQLSKSWEKALTDTDGQYAELMAGSYSDNQPNFSWLEPYETKEFSQYWYPISKIGTPTFANLNCVIKIEHNDSKTEVKLQATKKYTDAEIKITDEQGKSTCFVSDLSPVTVKTFEVDGNSKIEVVVQNNEKTIASYVEKEHDKYNMPEVVTDMPNAAEMTSDDELYMAGLHVKQYRDPAVEPDVYWQEALKRNPTHAPSLLAMAEYKYQKGEYITAKEYAEKAIKKLCAFNERLKSGEAYYIYAQILEAIGEKKSAYDYYYKASWAADSVCKSMTRIAMLDIFAENWDEAIRHAELALSYGQNNGLAAVCRCIALKENGKKEKADNFAKDILSVDPLNHLMRYISNSGDLFELIESDAAQLCLDLISDLNVMGRYEDIIYLIEQLEKEKPESVCIMMKYAQGYFCAKTGKDPRKYYKDAEELPLGNAYPVRQIEAEILRNVIACNNSENAKLLLGCLLYNNRRYSEALELWENAGENYIARRNRAVAYFSHFGKEEEALSLMTEILRQRPEDEQILYETIVLMDKTGSNPENKISIITSHKVTRDDIRVELAKAYNQNLEHDKTIDVLLSHDYTPCEGGEHALSDQYIAAYLFKGLERLKNDDVKCALEFFRKGQIIPQNMGAGVWNHCKLVPLKYQEARCLEMLGQKEDADKIFRYICDIELEYFSNMYLKELPFFQILSYEHLGEFVSAQRLTTRYLREWNKIEKVKDNGFFATTPFFISFVDQPEKLRKAQALYLTGLCRLCTGEREKGKQMLKESYQLNNENLFALLSYKYDF